jgi:hypothetical protein
MTAAEQLHAVNVRLRQISIRLRSTVRPGAGGRDQWVLAACVRDLDDICNALDEEGESGDRAGRGNFVT